MPTFDEFKTEGNRAFAAGEYKRAAKIYRDAISQHGNHAVLYSNRAQCFLNLKNWDRAYKDAEAGLACEPHEKIRVKLLYRMGAAAQNLERVLEAVDCFQQLLDIDPTNTGAQEELEKLTSVPKFKRLKAGESQGIPLEFVDELPQQFADLVSPPLPELVQSEKIVNSDLIENATQELFGQKEREAHTSKTGISEGTRKFTELPSMYFLKALKLVPQDKKVQSYRYVLGLEDSILVSLFQSLGVDHDYFEFFMEACAFTIAEDPSVTRSIVDKLQLMSKFNRFSLTLTMCDETLLDNLLLVVSTFSPTNLDLFKHLLLSR